jgi:hypothetical protein
MIASSRLFHQASIDVARNSKMKWPSLLIRQIGNPIRDYHPG